MVKKKDSINSQDAYAFGQCGCVDANTEYFNGNGWKRIADYTEGEQVLQYNTVTGEASLVTPERYIKAPCDKMYHFETAWGINQMLSPEHRVLYRRYLHRRKEYSEFKETSAEELYQIIQQRPFHGRIQTDFKYSGPGIELTDEEIKVMLAVIADGRFDNRYPHNARCEIRVKKERKIEELDKLFSEWGQPFNKTVNSEGYTRYSFIAPRREKEFTPYWYGCNAHQLKLICENVLKWDGSTICGMLFYSTIKASSDFVQFAFSACGYRATIVYEDLYGTVRVIDGKEYIRHSGNYRVNIAAHTMTGFDYINDVGENQIIAEEINPIDGYKYCFTVPTSALVLRREGRIFITSDDGTMFTE